MWIKLNISEASVPESNENWMCQNFYVFLSQQ